MQWSWWLHVNKPWSSKNDSLHHASFRRTWRVDERLMKGAKLMRPWWNWDRSSEICLRWALRFTEITFSTPSRLDFLVVKQCIVTSEDYADWAKYKTLDPTLLKTLALFSLDSWLFARITAVIEFMLFKCFPFFRYRFQSRPLKSPWRRDIFRKLNRKERLEKKNNVSKEGLQ